MTKREIKNEKLNSNLRNMRCDSGVVELLVNNKLGDIPKPFFFSFFSWSLLFLYYSDRGNRVFCGFDPEGW